MGQALVPYFYTFKKDDICPSNISIIIFYLGAFLTNITKHR